MALSGILQSTDWSFLVGGEVIQIAIGVRQIQVALFKDMLISIESDFIHERSGQGLSQAAIFAEKATTLVSLLGKVIERVEADAERALIVHFSGNETLVIVAKAKPYESFQVNGPNGLLVV